MKIRFVQSIFIFVYLCFLFPYIIFGENFIINNGFELKITLSYAIIIFSSFKLSILTLKGQMRLIEMSFWLFVYVWLGITSLGHALIGVFAWKSNYSDQEIVYVQLLIITSLIFYELGRKLTFKAKESKTYSEVKNNIKYPQKYINFSTISSLFLLFVIISVFMIYLNGGLTTIFATRFEQGIAGKESLKSLSLIIDSFKKIPIFYLLLYTLIQYKNFNYHKKDKIKFVILINFMLITNIIISNPIANPRFWFGAVFLSLIFVGFKWSKLYLGNLVISLSLILTILFPYLDVFRVSLENKVSRQDIAYLLLAKGDYDAFQQIMNAVRVVELKGIVVGEQLLGVIFFWFPRSMWEGKPLSTGELVGESLNYSFTNFSSPLWAEVYINFGYLGIPVLFYLYGKFTIFLQKSLIEKSNHSISHYMIACFFAAYQIFFLRGDLLNAVAYITPFILVTLFINKILKKERGLYEKNSIRN